MGQEVDMTPRIEVKLEIQVETIVLKDVKMEAHTESMMDVKEEAHKRVKIESDAVLKKEVKKELKEVSSAPVNDGSSGKNENGCPYFNVLSVKQ